MESTELKLAGKRALVLCEQAALRESLAAALASDGATVSSDAADVDVLVVVSDHHADSESNVSEHAARLDASASAMAERGHGRVIQILFTCATQAESDAPRLHMRTAQWRSLATTCARQHAAAGVTVNLIELALVAGVNDSDALAAEVLRHVPSARVVTPDEVAAAVLFLAAPQAAYMTGARLPVSGGAGLGLYPEQLR